MNIRGPTEPQRAFHSDAFRYYPRRRAVFLRGIRLSGVCAAGRCSLYLGNFARDNHVRAGDICLFQPMTNVKQRRFIVKVHILHKMSTDGTTQSSGGKGQDSHGCVKEGSSHNYKSENTPAVSYTSKEFSG